MNETKIIPNSITNINDPAFRIHSQIVNNWNEGRTRPHQHIDIKHKTFKSCVQKDCDGHF